MQINVVLLEASYHDHGTRLIAIDEKYKEEFDNMFPYDILSKKVTNIDWESTFKDIGLEYENYEIDDMNNECVTVVHRNLALRETGKYNFLLPYDRVQSFDIEEYAINAFVHHDFIVETTNKIDSHIQKKIKYEVRMYILKKDEVDLLFDTLNGQSKSLFEEKVRKHFEEGKTFLGVAIQYNH